MSKNNDGLEADAEIWDMGAIDWLVYEDSEGRLWFRPSLSLDDGTVYESRSGFGDDIYEIHDQKD